MKLSNIFRLFVISQPTLIVIYVLYFSFYRQLDPILEAWEIINTSELWTTADTITGIFVIILIISLIMLFFFIKYGRELYLVLAVIGYIFPFSTKITILTPIDYFINDFFTISTCMIIGTMYLTSIKYRFNKSTYEDYWKY